MTNYVFEPPVREARKARIVLDGPTGSGRTSTALRLAQGLGGPVGLVDTDRASAALYSPYFEFLHLPVNTFDPRLLIEVIAAAAAQRIGTLIIDSASPFWSGRSGLLALVDEVGRQKYKGNNSPAWTDLRPVEWDLMDALMGFPGHLIVTLRVRTDYQVQESREGRLITVKYGLKPDQRDQFDADFHVALSLDMAHTATVTKSRVVDVPVGSVIELPGEDLGKVIGAWLADGVEMPDAMDYRDQALDGTLTAEDLRDLYRQAARADLLRAAVLDENGKVTPLGDLIKRLGEQAGRRPAQPAQARQQATAPEVGSEYTPDNRQLVAQFTHSIAAAVTTRADAADHLANVEANLREAKAAGELGAKDYAHLYRVLEQRRADLGLPYGQPHTNTAEAAV